MSSCSFSKKSSDGSSDGIAGTYKTKVIRPATAANITVTLNEDNTLRGTITSNTTTETFPLVGSWRNYEIFDHIVLKMRMKESNDILYLYIRDGMAYTNENDMDAKYDGQEFIKISSD